MSYTAIYRKYRPSTFDDVAGQQHVVTTLKNALEQNRLAHAYLFSGPSGNGKTSIAKLFAKAINCESTSEIICDQCQNCIDTKNNNHPDVVEIDAASNNGVDEIRSLIEKVKYAPLNGKYKIYIIDEVHMLSLGAFNALLKTLEEPPAHVVFILATTEPHKVIPTIISRCQRYDFTRVKEKDIYQNIIEILKKENITYEEDAIRLISELADGGVRESLSILEQAIAYSGNHIKTEDVRKIYGIVTREEKIKLINLILNKEMQAVLEILNHIADEGNNLERLNIDLINMLKESVIYGYAYNKELLNVLEEKDAKLILDKENPSKLLEMIDILMEIATVKRTSSDIHAYLELAFIKMINLSTYSSKIETKSISKPESDIEENQREDENALKESVTLIEDESEVEYFEEDVVVEDGIVREIKDLDESFKLKLNDETKVNIVSDVTNNHKTHTNTLNFKEEKLIEKEVEDSFHQKELVQESKSAEIEEIEKPEIFAKEDFSNEEYLSLLANANKDKRLVIDSKWPKIASYCNDVKHAKHAHQLKDSKLIAVGDNYALVSVMNEMFAKNINDHKNQIGLSKFIKDSLEEDLRVFATHHENVSVLIEEFRARAAKGTLPEAIEVRVLKEDVKEIKKETLEDKAAQIFGEDGFIIEE